MSEVAEKKSLVTFKSPYAEDVIKEKAEMYAGLVVSDHKSYESTKKARTEFVKIRTSIQKALKVGNEDLMARVNANKDEARRLIELAKPTEEALQSEVKRWEAKKEEEKLAKLQAEAERVSAINDRIEYMRGLPLVPFGAPSSAIQERINLLHETAIDSSFEEFESQAGEVKAQALQILNDTLEKCLETERQAQEREEAERKMQEERKAMEEERAKIEAERAAIQAEKDRIAAEQRAKEEAIAQAKEEKERAERLEKERAEMAERMERERQEREARAKAQEEALAKQKEAEEAQAKEEAERAAKERVEALPEISRLHTVVTSFIASVPNFKTETARRACKDLHADLERLETELYEYINEGE